MYDAVGHTLRAGSVVHLIGGADTEVDAVVEEAAGDREILTVQCDGETTAEEIPDVRVPDGTFVYYADFGELPTEVQVTAAQRIKSHFEYGTPVIVRSSEASRGDLTLRNGDLVGRVRAIELDDRSRQRPSEGAE